MLASILTLSALLASFCILSTPHPADVALLQNARTPVSGASGFAALVATLEATASLPPEIPRIERDEAAPLVVARKNLPLWQALPAAERAALLPDLPPLLRFTHFRRAASIENLPKFTRLFALREINAFRFVSGKQEAALQSACDTAVIGRRLLLSDNLLLDSMLGVALLEQNVRLLAAMRAELPADAPLPAACAELQPLANTQLALAAQMYGEWRFFMSAEIEATSDWITATYLFAMRHLPRYFIRGFTRYAAPELLAAVARGEAAVPSPHPVFDFCSPLNGLCRLTSMRDYQARLLNANRYLAAFAVLRDPAHLPEGIRSDGAFLYIDLLPTQQGVQTLTLPLPGTQVR